MAFKVGIPSTSAMPVAGLGCWQSAKGEVSVL